MARAAYPGGPRLSTPWLERAERESAGHAWMALYMRYEAKRLRATYPGCGYVRSAVADCFREARAALARARAAKGVA